ncbi:serine/threonine protein kinase [Actinomadura terrae]|uniref:serine/threonine protein kinase n=1 Tax=Actinomadura terrae TaxID=604353 RepID=UPI002342FBA5|nr:serine/threonine protein kinase [Actinomadura terrae]
MPELQPGDPRRLGSYEIVDRLGEGGQGVVYAGVDASGNRAAIKLLRADLAGDAAARNRFVREAQAAKQVARFCTAQVLEADVAGDQPYIASEYVPGPSLYKQVTEQGPITGAPLDRLAIGTATALVAIHQAGIVHRDFKPHNVIMAPDGPRVIDFGIARALDTGQTAATKAIGTPSYMAPEQVAGATLTEAVDVWAWATTLVFAATGHPPFGDDTVVAVINRVMHEPPSLEGVPADLHRMIAACLVKEPERRPTAQQLMMALIGSGPGGAGAAGAGAAGVGQTRMDDPAQATSLLAEGSTLAAGAGAAAAMPRAGGPPGGRTQRVSPADYTGTLPPAGGPPYAGRNQGAGYGDYEPRRKSRLPIVAAVLAILVLALVVGVAMAKRGGNDPSSPVTPTVSESESESPTPTDDESEEPTPTRIPTRRPTREPTQEPTTERPSSDTPSTSQKPPTSEKPTSEKPPASQSPGGGGGGGGGGAGGGGAGGGGSKPLTGE